ncbi:MAG: hypothetical protein JO187_01790, partial [Acidobacteria bacterium]|nr:hypothetical protein [Acidobacteriota bacterium]
TVDFVHYGNFQAPVTGIADGGTTWFALEGTPNSLTLSQTATLTFTCASNAPCSNVQQQATFNCSPGGCLSTNTNAHSIKFTFDQVSANTTFQVNVTATELPGDGLCPIPPSGDANQNVATDFDCTLANFFGNVLPNYGTQVGGYFHTPFLFASGVTQVTVPFCLHYSHGNCVDLDAELQGASQGAGFNGFVHIYVAWNADTSTLFPPAGSPWRTSSYDSPVPQLYDAPHDDTDVVDYPPKPFGYPYQPNDLQKVFNVTGYYNPLGIAGKDGGVGTGPPSGVKTLNHYVVAFPLAPPDFAELDVPGPTPQTACYLRGSSIPLTFEIYNAMTNAADPVVQTPPHYLRVTVLQGGVYQNIGDPKIVKGRGTLYSTTLATANLKLNNETTNSTAYTLQIISDRIKKPVTKNFVVKTSCP